MNPAEPLPGRVAWGVPDLVDRFYPRYESENQQFASIVQKYLEQESVVLDAGCGEGNIFPHSWKEQVRLLAGCDLGSEIGRNPWVHAATLSDLARLPFRDRSFDIVFSRYVWEHLEHPQAVFAEIARILKPGGKLILLTPSRFHYVTMINRFTPFAIHQWISKLRGNRENDTFPTFYRASSRRDLVQCSRWTGLQLVKFVAREVRPNYLLWSLPAFFVGLAYERVVNRFDVLSPLRVSIIAVFEREA